MTRAEFNKWFAQFASAFPVAKEHVCKADKTGEATLGHWFAVLEKRDLADALTVTIGMFDGSLPAVPGTEKGFPDWSQVPKHVSRLCAEMHKVEPEWKKNTYRDRSKVGIIDRDAKMASAYKGALKILDDGGTQDDVADYLDEVFPGTRRAK